MDSLGVLLPSLTNDHSSQIINTGRHPFNQNSDQSDPEKWSTSKGGPVFSKLFRLDRTDPLTFEPEFWKFWVNGSRPLNRGGLPFMVVSIY